MKCLDNGFVSPRGASLDPGNDFISREISQPKCNNISSSSLEDLPSGTAYLSSFLELKAEDGEVLRAAKPLVVPLILAILDAVYVKLLSFTITAQPFVPRNTGYEGEVVESAGAYGGASADCFEERLSEG